MTTKANTRIWIASLLLVATFTAETGCSQPTVNPKPIPVNDHKRSQELSVKAAKLIDAKKTTPIATLTKQLKRTKCNITLPKPSKRQMTRPEIYRKNVPGVLIISGVYKCKKCVKWHTTAASGFAVTASGVIATNYHLFANKNSSTIIATTHDGKAYPVKEVLAANQNDDVVLLQLDTSGDKLTPMPISPYTPVGSDVTIISHPTHRFYTLSQGVISRYSLRRNKRGKTVHTMETTADFAKGSSGAPVFDSAGNVTGIVASTSSVYYTQTKDTQKNLQMVFKQCVPAASILKLINLPTKK
ncbi:MAG: trypsin-like peptidase domain-containing protein [Phycisphaerales bacterium]|jgi:serine protease Do|nr:trypsin-like peptidase domain-containing protein [Phycisphaerales bacterium]